MTTEIHPPKSKITFDKSINLGHVLTFVGFLIAGIGAWTSLDKRLVVIEENRSYQKMTDANQDQRSVEAYTSLRETLSRLDRQVERMADKLEKGAR